MKGAALTSNPPEQEWLEAAQGGSGEAFGMLVEPHRRALLAHCYRMLGSIRDAEDALQDALLRAWRGLPRFAGRSSVRSWLYQIATNACLDQLARRRKRVLPTDHGPAADRNTAPGEPLAESLWIEPYPDGELAVEDPSAAPPARYEQRESVELAFIAALQHLPPRQRAALILREVLGFSALEVASMLDTTVASVNSALRRARAAVGARLPEQSQQSTLRALGDDELKTVVNRYMDALASADIDALVAMLTDDATWSMPPLPTWYDGPGAIAAFFQAGPFRMRWRSLEARANAQPAVAQYAWDQERGVYVPAVLEVLTLRDARISAVTAFLDPEAFKPAGARNPEMFARFGLPAELPA